MFCYVSFSLQSHVFLQLILHHCGSSRLISSCCVSLHLVLPCVVHFVASGCILDCIIASPFVSFCVVASHGISHLVASHFVLLCLFASPCILLPLTVSWCHISRSILPYCVLFCLRSCVLCLIWSGCVSVWLRLVASLWVCVISLRRVVLLCCTICSMTYHSFESRLVSLHLAVSSCVIVFWLVVTRLISLHFPASLLVLCRLIALSCILLHLVASCCACVLFCLPSRVSQSFSVSVSRYISLRCVSVVCVCSKHGGF